MHRTGVTELVVEEIKRYDLEITGLSGTRWHGSGKARDNGLTFVHAGKEDETHQRGVATALGPKAEKMFETFSCVNERIVWYRLRGKYANKTMIQVYVPTEDKAVEEKDEFYGRLGEVARPVKRHYMLVLFDDFNAKVGQNDGIW